MKIALCLSGGGFRAMLFHLGAIRRLAHEGWLGDVQRIDSVSGGSILAAHLALNWPAYCADATRASADLVSLARCDVRGRIVRRRLLWILCPALRQPRAQRVGARRPRLPEGVPVHRALDDQLRRRGSE